LRGGGACKNKKERGGGRKKEEGPQKEGLKKSTERWTSEKITIGQQKARGEAWGQWGGIGHKRIKALWWGYQRGVCEKGTRRRSKKWERERGGGGVGKKKPTRGIQG